MATRPLAFGLRLRDRKREKTLRVRGAKGRYVVSDEQAGVSRERAHASLGDAVRDAAATWRRRLN